MVRTVEGAASKLGAVARGPSAQSPESRISALSTWRYVDASVLGVMVVAIMTLDLVWIALDSRAPYFDYARHLGDSLFYRTTFTSSDWLLPLKAYVEYPPFAYWLTDLFYAIFGTAQWVAILSNSLFLSILVFATYGIGKTLWSRRVGVLSAVFVVTTPMFVTAFKEYMLDAPLTAMIALALYFLIRSEQFSVRRYSLLFGATCGIGMLTKWGFALSIGLPVAFSVVTAIWRALPRRRLAPLLNAAAAGLLAFAICGLWYVHNWSQISERASVGAVSGYAPRQFALGSLSANLWYFWNLVNNQLYLIPSILFLVGLIVVLSKNESASRNTPLILNIVGTYVAWTLVRNKDFRYTMPMLPAVAVVAVHWLDYIRLKARSWLSGGLILYGALAFLVISFGTSLLPKEITIHLKPRPYTSDLFEYVPPESVTSRGITIFAQHGFIVGKPSHQQWYVDQAFKEIAAQRKNRSFWYQADADTIWFNAWDVRYYAYKYHLNWYANQEACDFLVVRHTGPPTVVPGFVQFRQFPLPDGGTLRLYQRL